MGMGLKCLGFPQLGSATCRFIIEMARCTPTLDRILAVLLVCLTAGLGCAGLGAGSMAMRAGALDADPVLLEPVMSVEVVTPEDYYGDIVGDLNRRRGVVLGMEDVQAGKAVRAEVPMSTMFGYATDMRSATQGRATFSMEFSRYKEVPDNIAKAIIDKS